MTAAEIRKLFDRATELVLSSETLPICSEQTARSLAVHAAAIASCCESADQPIDVRQVVAVLVGALLMSAASHPDRRDVLRVVIGSLEVAAGLRDTPTSRGLPS